MRYRLRFPAHFLSAVALFSVCMSVFGQAPAQNQGANPADPDAILQELAPDTIELIALRPKPADRVRAIRLLLGVKRQDTGWNRQLAAYLLASLGYEYASNRDELLQAWNHCVAGDYGEECDERTAMTLIGLYRQGHKEVLRPLVAGGPKSDGALSEELFPFYAEELEIDSKDFLAVLATFPIEEQQHTCEGAAGGDGGGMGSDVLRKVLRNLRREGGVVAERCARSYKAGDKAADENNRGLTEDSPR